MQVVCGTRDCGDFECSPETSAPPLDFTCPTPDGFYEDPDNCIKYFRCSGGVVNPITCKPGAQDILFGIRTVVHCHVESIVDF